MIQWKGIPTKTSKDEVKFVLNPTEVTVSSSEVTLTYPKKCGKKPSFTLNQETTFTGKLVSIGLIFVFINFYDYSFFYIIFLTLFKIFYFLYKYLDFLFIYLCICLFFLFLKNNYFKVQ